VPICNSTGGMPQYLDGRLWHVLVMIGRARLAKVFEHPRALFPCVDAPLRTDAGQFARLAETVVWPTSATDEDRDIEILLLWPDTLQMEPNRAIHRPPKCLASLDASVVQPTPRALLFDLPIGRLTPP